MTLLSMFCKLYKNVLHICDITSNTIRIMYTGHDACYYSVDDGHVFGIAGLSDYVYPIICIKASPMNLSTSYYIMAHEIAHLYGILHHERISETPCIMDQGTISWFTGTSGTYFCRNCISSLRAQQTKDWTS